jgi:hypothetical protein
MPSYLAANMGGSRAPSNVMMVVEEGEQQEGGQVTPVELGEYEKERLANIRNNDMLMQSLGLGGISSQPVSLRFQKHQVDDLFQLILFASHRALSGRRVARHTSNARPPPSTSRPIRTRDARKLDLASFPLDPVSVSATLYQLPPEPHELIKQPSTQLGLQRVSPPCRVESRMLTWPVPDQT